MVGLFVIVLLVSPGLVWCKPPWARTSSTTTTQITTTPVTTTPITTTPVTTTPITTTPVTTTPITTTPNPCICPVNGTQIQPGETFMINPCHGCTCDATTNEIFEFMASCMVTFCVDQSTSPGDCCATCPTGENCLAEFNDTDGSPRREIIYVSNGTVYFGAVGCYCDTSNYYSGDNKAICIEAPPPSTTVPPMCTCSDGTQIPPGDDIVWVQPCLGCYCGEDLQVQTVIADCFHIACVDSVVVEGQCCRDCPNGENCLAEFYDFDGSLRREIVPANVGVVDFGSALCVCDPYAVYGYSGDVDGPIAACAQVEPTTTVPTSAAPTTP